MKKYQYYIDVPIFFAIFLAIIDIATSLSLIELNSYDIERHYQCTLSFEKHIV